MPKMNKFIIIIQLLVVLRCKAEWQCPNGENLQPQLSTTFLKGYWYEHLYTNTLSKNETCSHFEIKCHDNFCEIYHVIWDSYYLKELWNGTITQTENQVDITINDEQPITYKDVNLRFQNDAVLIWSCEEASLVFASLMYRMVTDDEMENTWDAALRNSNYPPIIADFPPGLWNKINPLECINSSLKLTSNILLISLLIIKYLHQLDFM